MLYRFDHNMNVVWKQPPTKSGLSKFCFKITNKILLPKINKGLEMNFLKKYKDTIDCDLN
jgi:hypothetical protein